MARGVSAEEFDQITGQSNPAPQAPVRARGVSPIEFDQLPEDPIPAPVAPPAPAQAPAPEQGTSPLEPFKALELSARQTGATLVGSGLEMLGQVGANTVDTVRAPQYFPGMTAEQAQEITAARQAMTPTQNPLIGARDIASGLWEVDRPDLQMDPRLSPEQTPYLGDAPLTRKANRLATEVAGAIPFIGGVTAATAMGGPTAGGATAGVLMGAQKFDESMAAGDDPNTALQKAGVVAGLGSALFAVPVASSMAKYLPQKLWSRLLVTATHSAETGAKMMGLGGVDAAAELENIPASTEEWGDAFSKMWHGSWDHRSHFLAGAVLGIPGGLMTKIGRQQAQQKAQDALGDFIDLGDATVRPSTERPAGEVSGPSTAIATPPRRPATPEDPQFVPGPRELPAPEPTPASPVQAPSSKPKTAQELAREIFPDRPDLADMVARAAEARKTTTSEQESLEARILVAESVSAGEARVSQQEIARQERQASVFPEIPLVRPVEEPVVQPSKAKQVADERRGKLYDPASDAALTGQDGKTETISGVMDYDEFERKGYAPNEVTRDEWVALMRANRRKLGQSEESGTQFSPFGDYTEYHRADVERAIKAGEFVDDRVLADYPDLAPATPEEPVSPPPVPTKGEKLQQDRAAKRAAREAAKSEGTSPTPQDAEFKGWQPNVKGKPPIALYNIPEGTGKSTVTAETARQKGFNVPEPPPPPAPPQNLPAPEAPPQAGEVTAREVADIMASTQKMPSIREVREIQGDDGNWYRATGIPANVKSTGQTRLKGYAFVGPGGATYGKLANTPGELEQRWRDKQEYEKNQFIENTKGESPERLEEIRQFYEKERARDERLNAPIPKTGPTPTAEQNLPSLGTGSIENDRKLAELRNRSERLRGRLSHGAEATLKRLEGYAKADPTKWAPGNGVGRRIGGKQINRGFRVAEVDPETKQAKIIQVADTGLTTTGGDFDKIGPEWVHIGNLVRDRKYDAQAPVEASPPSPPTRPALRADFPFEAPAAKPSAPAAVRDSIRQAALDIAGGETETRVRLADLREKMPDVPREELDAALKQMQQDRDLNLYRNDDPQDMTQRDQDARLMLGSDQRDMLYLKPEKTLASPVAATSTPEATPAAPAPEPAATGTIEQRFADLVQRQRDGKLTPEQFLKERAVLQKEKARQGKAKAPKKKGKRGADPTNPEAGVFNVGLILDLLDSKPFVRFLHGMREEIRDLDIRRKGHINMLLRQAEAAANDLRYAYQKARGGATAPLRGIPEDLRFRASDYMREKDPATKRAILNSFPVEMQNPLRQLRTIQDQLSSRLINEDVISPSRAKTVKSNIGSYLTRQYRMFNYKNHRYIIEENVKDRMRTWLWQQYPEFKNEPNGHIAIETLLNEWINVGEDEGGGLFWRGGMLGARNFDNMKQRNAFPQEVFDLWGLENDVVKNFTAGVAKQATQLANTRFLTELVKAGRAGNYIFTQADIKDIISGKAPRDKIEAYQKLVEANNLVTIADAAELHEQLKGKPAPGKFSSLGPLAETAVARDVKESLQDIMKVQEMHPVVGTIVQINGLLKMMKTVGSASTQALNFGSNIGFALNNGWLFYDVANLPNRIETALAMTGTELSDRLGKGHRELAGRAIELGVLLDADVSGEIQRMVKEGQSSYLGKPAHMLSEWGERYMANQASRKKQLTGKAAQLPLAIQAAAGKARDVLVNIYQAGDDFWKSLGWLTETAHLQEAYGMSLAEAQDAAAKRLRKFGLPYYSETPSIVQFQRYNPISSPFLTFSSETPRILWNSEVQTKAELTNFKNDKARRMGYRRLMGQLIAYGAPVAAVYMGKLAWDLSDEDDQTINTLGPIWNANTTKLPYSVDKENGIVKYLNLSRSSVQGQITDPVNAFARADDAGEGAIRALMAIADPVLQEQIGWQAMRQFTENRDEFDRPVWNRSDSWPEFAYKVSKHFGKAIEPGTMDSLWRITHDDAPAQKTVAEALGLRTTTVNMPMELRWRAARFQRSGEDTGGDVRKALNRGDTEDIAEQVKQKEEWHRAEWDLLHEAVSGALSFGVKREIVKKSLMDGGMSGIAANRVMNGVYKPQERSKEVKKALRPPSTPAPATSVSYTGSIY